MVESHLVNGQAAGSESPALFQPLRVGDITLQHRVVLAPLTRYRADLDHVHHDVATEYYAQRAQEPGTLVVSEGTFISPAAGGFDNAPGIYTPEQIAAWKKIVDAVHAKGSFMFMQLWNLGRAAHEQVLARDGLSVLAPSDVGLSGGAKPKAMTLEQIEQFKQMYARAARNFVQEAGGDGVELHFANGYMVDQFFSTTSNFRTDRYGGSVENRIRFGLEIVDAVVKAIGAKRTALRISPYSPFQEMKMDAKDIKETFGAFVTALKEEHPDLAYLHVVRSRIAGSTDVTVEGDQEETLDFLQSVWTGPFFIAGAFKREDALQVAQTYPNAAIVFGRYFISNPDLVKRLRDNLPLTPYNRDTFYTKGPQAIEGSLEGFRSEQAHADTPADSTGYTDYESYSKQQSFSDLKDIHNLVQALATTVSA